MTALDDALNSSSIVYGPHQLRANWRESDLDADDDLNEDSPTLLTEQSDGTFSVSHAINDALPEPVTMTADGDPSGILTAGLLGREGLIRASSGFRAYDAAGGSWDTGTATQNITAPITTGSVRDDLLIAVVVIDDSTASLVQTYTDPRDAWDFVGVVSDGPLAMHVYLRRRRRTAYFSQLVLQADKPVDFMSLSMAFWARSPTDACLDYRITDVQFKAETVSGTGHSISQTMYGRGYRVAFYGSDSAAGAITHTAPMSLYGSPSGSGLIVSGGISAFTESGVYTNAMTQANATGTMVMAALSVEPYERPRMDAQQYFSPFNVNSPVYGWDRDTADVTMSARVLTTDGASDTQLFKGQMQGVQIQGREAEMQAVSKTRISLNRSIPLPMVSGVRENLMVDWIVTYLMARGGSFVGPAPNKYTRYWAPLYGSLHAHWDTPESYNAAYLRDSINPFLLFGLRNPKVVGGRWMAAMYGQQTSTRMEEISLVPRKMYQMSRNEFPHLYDNNGGGPVMADMLSLSNSRGKLQFWVRGDAAQSAPSYLDPGDDYLVKMNMTLIDGGNVVGLVEVGIASNSRNPYVRMGTTAAGTLSTSFVFSGLPTDGSWNFVGIHWDFAAGTANACFNGSVITANGWVSGGYNDTSGLPSTDAAGRNAGMSLSFSIKSHLPASDFIFDCGETYVAGQWAEHYPTPKAPGNNSTYLASYVKLAALAESTAVNAWDTIGELAQAVQAWYRCNENDVLDFTIVEWFGRAGQMVSAAVQDTDTNASDMDLMIDASKIRNVVTIKYPETRVDTQPQFVLQYLTSTPIPNGVSKITFPLDVPVVELHGQSSQSGSSWDIVNLTSTQITTPTLPKQNHFITVNTTEDGGGTVLSAASVTAKIVAWDAGSVTLQFTNVTGSTKYLANNGDQIPFLQILGYGARISDAYTTVRDSDSVLLRRERALETEMNWIQTRSNAELIALQLVNFLSRSNAVVRVTVMGDPRRKPGQLVTLIDKEGMSISGTWRVLSVDHDMAGPKYTQNVLLLYVDPVGLWDTVSSTWDHSVWGE